MPHDGFAAHDEANEQAVPAMSGTEPGAMPDSVPTSQPEPVVGFDKTPDPDPAPDSAPTSQLEPPLDLEPTPDPNPTPERSHVARRRWHVDMTDPVPAACTAASDSARVAAGDHGDRRDTGLSLAPPERE